MFLLGFAVCAHIALSYVLDNKYTFDKCTGGADSNFATAINPAFRRGNALGSLTAKPDSRGK
jgi:hypothetical protein